MKKNISLFITDNLDEDSGFLMLRVSKLWEEAHERALKKHYDISHLQYAVLASVHWLILHGQKEVTQIVLSQHTKINPMAISLTLKDLEYKGYVCRKTSAADARAKCTFITDKGQELMQSVFVKIFAADEKFFNVLGGKRQKFNSHMLKLLQANE
ncbi:MAG: MarR family winged helix-turn-helix transcriptional regulator [Paludibacter sp.]|nr:MarR family winged helix-turn-helix transcriptional regulator [Paludibacter sp.]